MNELATCMQVDVTIRARISDDTCCIGISITFRMNLYLYRDVSDYIPRETKKEFYISDSSSAIEYLKNRQPELKQCYSDWNDIMLECQKVEGAKKYKSIEEASPAVLEIGKKQVGIRDRIEAIILETDELMEKYYKKGADEKAATSYLLFLSNCFQAIRDLTVTFEFGPLELRHAVDPLPRAAEIAEKWLERYANLTVVELISKRKSLSENIETNFLQASDDKRKVCEYTAEGDEAAAKRYEEVVRNYMNRIDRLSKHYDKLMQAWPDIDGHPDDIEKCHSVLNQIQEEQDSEIKVEVSPEEATKILNDEIRICREFLNRVNREILSNVEDKQKEFNELEEAKKTAEQMIGICQASGMFASVRDMQSVSRTSVSKQKTLAQELFQILEYKFREIDRKLSDITQDSLRAPAGVQILEKIHEWDTECGELAQRMHVDKLEYIVQLKKKWDDFYKAHSEYKKVIYEPELKNKEVQITSIEDEVKSIEKNINSQTEYKNSLGFFRFKEKKEIENKIAYLQEQLISKKNKLREVQNEYQAIVNKMR